ncbi:serine protein kinase RIO [Candidatus Woesearchaeota archaeon]|jgi:RIO kinase 1|nr:serine protein kinase RIO [Candidatus Woesearchaeota archaeon]MBT5271862.1 serine protein kinase RIO [Candidatus Woesearchaeota archaeon]MBT6041674.1 serine protein kinase RIO [Candidatus Woesearchaeota archaeon]MBT6337350.1 serine protein kinase RIO [Candidatus Woesearchaeota archaeon]MBT7927598.1 serine protein kinase RIO [Candidatus Woesearchaeota archaeon]
MARKARKEEWKVWGNVFDNYTNRNLFKLKGQGYFDELESPISVGKEANIFSAKTKDGKRVIIKIYRLETCNFNKMFDYIRQDPRYAGMKNQRRKVIFSWTQREQRNLLKSRQVGVRVPLVHTCLDNILVLEYIGDDIIALQLKNHFPKNKTKFLNKIIEYMHIMWKKARLVHGDLSCFNILNYNENPVFIDFSQTTDIKSQNAKELLIRDIKNISVFFRKIGLKNVNEEKILKKVLK